MEIIEVINPKENIEEKLKNAIKEVTLYKKKTFSSKSEACLTMLLRSVARSKNILKCFF